MNQPICGSPPTKRARHLPLDVLSRPVRRASIAGWHAILESLLPAACPVCAGSLPGASPGGVCPQCWTSVRPLAIPWCVRCSLPLPAEAAASPLLGASPSAVGQPPKPAAGASPVCLRCAAVSPPFATTRALSAYEAVARDILHTFKLGAQPELARPLGRMMADRWRGEPGLWEGNPLAVPVPQRLWKERMNGYNPARLLARGLARELGLPVAPRALRKLRWTPDQARLGSAELRAVNLKGAFQVRKRDGDRLAGRRAVLVDDIVTTGATAAECARALLAAGALDVIVLAVARTPRLGGEPLAAHES